MKNTRIALPVLPGTNIENYLNALSHFDAESVVSERPCDLEDCDGLLLPGGWDADPALYGQPNRGSQNIDRILDNLQLEALNRFVLLGKPCLGICRGMQLMNVYFGGTLIQHLPTARLHSRDAGVPKDKVHPTRAEEGSLLHKLYGAAFAVNSSHHQAADAPGQGIRITQYSADGVAEGLEHRCYPVWGVQWHPERMCLAHARPDTVDGLKIFEAFLKQCAKY